MLVWRKKGGITKVADFRPCADNIRVGVGVFILPQIYKGGVQVMVIAGLIEADIFDIVVRIGKFDLKGNIIYEKYRK